MTLAEAAQLVAQVSGLLFIVTSMLAMGLSLKPAQITAPLRNVRLVALALLANFVVAPLVAMALAQALGLDDDLRVGMLLLGMAAGAPFLPKLVQGAKGDVAFGVGLMVLLMVVTVGYVPVVLPLLLPDVTVDARAIAGNLIVLMLTPLALGLLARSLWADEAAGWQPVMSKASSLAMLVLLVTGLGLSLPDIASLVGTGGLIALVVFTLANLAVGLLFGGRDPAVRSVMGLGTAQRNISAAIVVAAANFAGTSTLSFVLVAALLLLVILLPTARVLAGRAGPPAG